MKNTNFLFLFCRTIFFKQREKQKLEAVRLGVELSLFVAEAMFLLSDDIRSVLLFSYSLFKYAGKGDYDSPVVGRLIHVIQYVFETYIKPKNGVYQDGSKSIQFELIKTSPQHFTFGVRVLDRIVSILKDDVLMKPSVFEIYDQELKKLEDKFRFAKHVSEANGFAREAIESNILHLWKSLFETTPEVINPNKTIILELFRPVENEGNRIACCRRLASLLI